jgi:flagellar biosynthesis activator protein FlaF
MGYLMGYANVYDQVHREALEGRELEASVLFRAAQKLNQCARDWENGHTKEFQEKLTDALQFNQKLWSFLQVELGNPANPLPETLRLNLLRLSKFVDKEIFTLFAGGGTVEDLLSIARVNEQIGRGLQVRTTASSGADMEDDGFSSISLLDIAG